MVQMIIRINEKIRQDLKIKTVNNLTNSSNIVRLFIQLYLERDIKIFESSRGVIRLKIKNDLGEYEEIITGLKNE